MSDDAATLTINAPLQATVAAVLVEHGQQIRAGEPLMLLEAMKMQHAISAERHGTVAHIAVSAGDLVQAGAALVRINAAQSGDTDAAQRGDATQADISRATGDDDEAIPQYATADQPTHSALGALHAARALTADAARPDAIAKRHARGQLSARENIAALVDAGSFREYGSLVFAAQRTRRSIDDLKQNTPADGLVAGVARINGEQFGAAAADCAVLHYDYTVLAGTQGAMNHAKTDRLLDVAAKRNLPVVFFTEGGGGRPGDVDVQTIAGLHIGSFASLARLSGQVPLVGIVGGYCFAGNAAFLGCCDVIIATRHASIGMGGPAMIEGGGLGSYHPRDVGPVDVQRANGVIDIVVDDEREAVAVAKRYLGYFQGRIDDWRCAAQSTLRDAVPANRLQVYDMRAVIDGLADSDSVLELRRDFGNGMITALARIGGRPVGLIANNPAHLAGAIDRDAADKAARFMQLCDAHGLPIVSLCDTPGIMVGPDSEASAHVRHCSRLFVTGANLSVPMVMVVIRKAYGLGAMAMAGGGFHEPLATLAWPSGEFGAMGLEGAVRLGYRKELEAEADADARQRAFDARVADAYERGKALNAAPFFEFDEVIDPAETRDWILSLFDNAGPSPQDDKRKRRPNIDSW